MIKLYKKLRDYTLYWEAWDSSNEITVHWGVVGEVGETREIQLKAGETPDWIIEREAKRPKAEGYRAVARSKLTRLIIQYPVADDGTSEDLDKRARVEDLMNERLGWKGLGHCDGGDMGTGTMNVFCFVIDAKKAVPHVLEELKTNRLLDGVLVAISSKQGEQVLWPENFTGRFSI